jgi:uncharacterized membrane protein
VTDVKKPKPLWYRYGRIAAAFFGAALATLVVFAVLGAIIGALGGIAGGSAGSFGASYVTAVITVILAVVASSVMLNTFRRVVHHTHLREERARTTEVVDRAKANYEELHKHLSHLAEHSSRWTAQDSARLDELQRELDNLHADWADPKRRHALTPPPIRPSKDTRR